MEGGTIIHSLEQPCSACCLTNEGIVVLASTSALLMVDVLTGQIKAIYRSQWPFSPVLLAAINKQQHKYLLQNKDGMIFLFTATDGKISIHKSYSIDMHGFTKLSLLTHAYIANGQFLTTQSGHFLAVSEGVRVIRRTIEDGKIAATYSLQDGQLGDVTAMLNYSIEGQEYLLLAVEGALLKKIKISSKTTQQSQICLSEQITLQTNQQIKYIPCIEPINNFRAILPVRDDKMHIVNLSKLQIVSMLDYTFVRIVKNISKQYGLMAVAGKDSVGLMKDGKMLKKEKVPTSFVMDISVNQDGVVGVTQEGRLLFLPLQ